MIDLAIAYNQMYKKKKEDKKPKRILNLDIKVKSSNKDEKTRSHFRRYLGR